ncbi:PD-(D/E)XK nuclease-like domain-containing protein [Paenibacillus amylolyticus]|uniref:PD-(D/E)XK nuclease-like domain-containing protein n=1 Tax=Paenibacillus amylolyticus TaxID=1451 RepID=UPI003242B361
MLELNDANYHSKKANRQYMSVSQYKDFLNCEAGAMAKLQDEYKEPESDALLIGSYVHAHFEGVLDSFKIEHPELFLTKGSRKGELYEKYNSAEKMIQALEKDPFCTFILQGEKETIVTAEFGGVPWKAKIDVLNKEQERFADIKTVKDIYGKHWSREHGAYVSFVEAYGYVLQMAMYAELERIWSGRDTWLEPAIVAVSKEDVPAVEVIGGFEPRIELETELVKENLPGIIAVKSGLESPRRCERCAYCRSTRQLRGVIHYMDLMP